MAEIDLGMLFPKALSRPLGLKSINPSINGVMITWRNKGGVHTIRSFDRPAPTLDKAGGHIEIEGKRYSWPLEDQIKIQSFPLQFIFEKDKSTEIIGNSVPPMFMRAIALQIKHTLLGGGSRSCLTLKKCPIWKF